MADQNRYMNYRKYALRIRPDCEGFDFGAEGYGWVLHDVHITLITKDSKRVILFDKAERTGFLNNTIVECNPGFCIKPAGNTEGMVCISITKDGLQVTTEGIENAKIELSGHVVWGNHDQRETMAVCINRIGSDLRTSSGPATSNIDNALFDKDTDAALVFDTDGRFRMKFDWEQNYYRFTWRTISNKDQLSVSMRPHIFEDILQIDYKRQNEATTFKTPPVGWMTWYAVKFNAGKKTVMENAEAQRKYLKRYGADTIWVDWEWYHTQFNWSGSDSIDMFHPNKETYPDGLKQVAEDITQMGFIPALWVGPTCDPSENEIIKQHPEAIAIRQQDWCGQYFFDITHPVFLEQVLPKMMRQTCDWGYKALKWDCMPATQYYTDLAHENLYNHDISTHKAMRNMFAKARETVGKNFYMLYCCSLTAQDVELACSNFDGVRIGNDIFKWEDFTKEMVDKVFAYYALHNVMLLADPDNVVIRDEFNTIYQSQTRAAIVSLLGLPFTLGDDLTKLDKEHMSILQRSIPPIPYARPMDIRSAQRTEDTFILNLSVERAFGSWNVIDVINLKNEKQKASISIEEDVHLDTDGEKYIAYDFWNGEVFMITNGGIELSMEPCQSRILSIVKLAGHPVVISTSRHISHGAIDLKNVEWKNESLSLNGVSMTVVGDDYSMVIAAPCENMEIIESLEDNRPAEIEIIRPGVWRIKWKQIVKEEINWVIRFK